MGKPGGHALRLEGRDDPDDAAPASMGNEARAAALNWITERTDRPRGR